MSQQQESQQPTSERPTELQSDGPQEIVVPLKDQYLIFGNDPSRSQVSNSEFRSLVSEVFRSDARETSEGISCGDPNCPRTHTQSEADLIGHLNSGRISFARRPKPSILLSLASRMLASAVKGSVSLEESEQNPKEGSNLEQAEESKLDPRTEDTWEGSSSLPSETPADSKGGPP